MDSNVETTLQEVKKLVESSDSNDSVQCNAVLNKFHTACDPSAESCSSANQQTFQGETLFLSSLFALFSLSYLFSLST